MPRTKSTLRKLGKRQMVRIELQPADLDRVRRAAEAESRSASNLIRLIVCEAVVAGLPEEIPAYDLPKPPRQAVCVDLRPETIARLDYETLSGICRCLLLAWLAKKGY
jgi:hypothetical protein